jgi:hypothetical protein
MENQIVFSRLKGPAHYMLQGVREFVGVTLPADGLEARIRLNLDDAVTLDIPLSRNSLVALAHDLRGYLPKDDQ